MTVSQRHVAFLAEMQREFPTFSIERKRDDRIQVLIDRLLKVATLGGQRSYLTQYHTVLFGKLWVPDSWDRMSDVDRYILLRHEVVHLRQGRRLGFVPMAFLYLFWCFPLGLAYGRARIEWEAYEETIRATDDVLGRDAALALRSWLVARFVGPDYGWMWPFPRTIERWFDAVVATLPPSPAARSRTDVS